MSEEKESEALGTNCASCGKAEIDGIKLKDCDGCDLIRYCSDECQEDHKLEHEEECNKRAAELRDKLLFKQPESSHLGDCPICCLPLPIDTVNMIQFCCSKTICKGCFHAHMLKEGEGKLANMCPFCRISATEAYQEFYKRIASNDPVALCQEGVAQHAKADFSRAFEWYTKAAELGDAKAHYKLALMYRNGEGVQKDDGKYIYHLEEAAIGGHPLARYDLGVYESNNGNIERAVKHWIIAATLESDLSTKELMTKFREGSVSKEDLDVALSAHKAAVDATKSPQREEAEVYYRNL